MSYEVELFRTDDYIGDSAVPLIDLLRAVFEPQLRDLSSEYEFEVELLPIPDRRVLSGSPTLVNLRPEYGLANVHIFRGNRLVYSRTHSVRDVVAQPLQRLIAARTDGTGPVEQHWGFQISGPGLEDLAMIRPAPRVEGGFVVRAGAPRSSALIMEEVSGPEPPPEQAASLGITGEAADTAVRVALDASVFEGLKRTMVFSDEVEEGGFLIGQVFRDAGRTSGYLVKVTASVPAQRTGASMLHFTFTGESFLRVTESLSVAGDKEQLLGWYHTHLFSATDALGLSSIDVDLHMTTFTRPWQVAALVNIEDDGRILRVYAGDEGTMTEIPYWVAGVPYGASRR